MTKAAVPVTGDTKSPEWLLKLATRINDLTKGWMNVTGLVTLRANQTTTVLTDDRISVDTALLLSPTTANAAAELGNGTLFMAETSRVNGSITITHANNAQADRTFRFAIVG